MDLHEFDQDLRQLVGGDERIRPFVCDGSPLSCPVFIVGANPATDVAVWPFWDASHGFHKEHWLRSYEDARVARGMTKRSATRNRIERIVSAALPTRCLETNVYTVPSHRLGDLELHDRRTRVFEFLLAAIRPCVLHVHGEEAREYFRCAYGVTLLVDQATTIPTRFGHVRVLPTHHLAYQWSYSRADETGRWLHAQAVPARDEQEPQAPG